LPSGRSPRIPAGAVLTHFEEMDRLSHDELVRLGAADGWEPAWDGLLIDVAPNGTRIRASD